MDLAALTDAPPEPKRTPCYEAGYVYTPPQHYLYFDFETPYTTKYSLKSISLRDYVEYIKDNIEEVTVSWAIDDGEPEYAKYGEPGFATFIDLFSSPAYLSVSHNSAFDLRVATLFLGCAYPNRSHCTMEMARRCLPSQPKGHGLDKLMALFPNMPQKIEIDLTNCTDEELRDYCVRDTECCRWLHKVFMDIMPPEELLIAEQAALIRSLVYNIRQDLAATAHRDFLAVATEAVADQVPELFGWTGEHAGDGDVKSVRYQALKKYLADEMGFVTDSTSKKKINPEELLRSTEEVRNLIDSVAEIGKALSFARRAGSLTTAKVDLGYVYYAAHTGRPSGKGEGRGGLNALNLPKHNKKIANIIRPLYELPEDYYHVCADFANVEYRTLGLITGCKHIHRVFDDDPMADPYAKFCEAATGRYPDKRDPRDVPIRQVFKKGVLSLTYLAGLNNWVRQMLIALATGEVTIEQVEEIIREQNWKKPRHSKWVRRVQSQTHAPDSVMALCFHTFNLFHEVHPEFAEFGAWLVGCCEGTAGSLDPDYELEVRRKYRGAPDPKWLELHVDWDKKNERSITARCGLWSPTVCWRDLATTMVKRNDGNGGTKQEPALTIFHERQGRRPVTKNLVIENVNQSFARNAMCALKIRMQDEFPFMYDIYDELRAVVHRDQVVDCRNTILKHAGVDSDGCGYGWAVLVDPTEIDVSSSFKGFEPKPDWWSNPDWSLVP